MPVLYWVVPYIICGGVLWFIIHQISPVPRDVPLSDVIRTIFVFALIGLISRHFLEQHVGYWRIIPELIFDAFVVREILDLSFRRSLVAVMIYLLVLAACIGIMAAVAKGKQPPPRIANKPTTSLSIQARFLSWHLS